MIFRIPHVLASGKMLYMREPVSKKLTGAPLTPPYPESSSGQAVRVTNTAVS